MTQNGQQQIEKKNKKEATDVCYHGIYNL
ncbi:MAG: hypothetical protein ACI9QN_001511, partial [Arcticibacterium sp.]